MLEMLAEKRIKRETTTPYCPRTNGCAERFNYTLLDSVRSTLIDCSYPYSLWGELIMTVNYILNQTGIKSRNNIIPYKVFYKRIVDPAYFLRY
jgi:transposase InsO family protein